MLFDIQGSMYNLYDPETDTSELLTLFIQMMMKMKI